MKPYRWVLGFLGVGVFAMAGCSPDWTDPGYYLVNGGKSHAVISPNAYMAAVGCSPHEGPRDSTTIVFRLIGGGMARFACGNVKRDSVKTAIHAYRDAVFASTGAIQSGGGGGDGYVYVHTYYSCDIYTHYQYVPAIGEYVYAYSDTYCTYWEIWSDPAGAGYTPPPPPPPKPVPLPIPPLPADSCRSGDLTPAGQPGPLNARGIQDGFNALLAASQADPPTEMAKGIARTANGSYYLFDVTISRQDNCSVDFSINTNNLPTGDVLVGWVHTHPYKPGTYGHCRLDTQNPNSQSQMVSVSNRDWANTSMTNYVVGTDSIYKLVPGLTSTQQLAPESWGRVANGCAIHKQY